MNTYLIIRKLAKSIKSQNQFTASKDVHGINLFSNTFNFSRLQEIYISYLYMYNSLMKDIMLKEVNEKVLDNDIYEESYILWRKKNFNKKDQNNTDKKRDLKLVPGKKINFPKR